MKRMDSWTLYRTYLATTLHFKNPKYDVFQMQGRVKASKEQFATSPKLPMFNALAAKLKDQTEAVGFLVSNIVQGDPNGGVFDRNSDRVYQSWLRRNQSLSYTFTKDLQKLAFEVADLDDIVKPKSPHEPPYIVQEYMAGSVCIETLVILDALLEWVTQVDQVSKDKMVWPEISMRLKKYRPFLRLTETKKAKYGQILKDVFGNGCGGQTPEH